MNAITVEISKMTLAPGDVVVLRTERQLTQEQRKHVRDVFQCALPDGVKCIALDGGMEIEVFTTEEPGMPDTEFLRWIHARLVEVHGENKNADYMLRLRAIISKWVRK